MISKLDSIAPAPASGGKTIGGTGAAQASAPAGGFVSALSEVMNNSIETLRQGEIAAAQGLKGEIPIQDAVNKVLEAEQSLQVGIALRDKVVAAYLEVSRMTI